MSASTRRLAKRSLVLAAAVAGFSAFSGQAQAQSTWSGANSVNWSDALNWDVAPTGSGEDLIFTGAVYTNLPTNNDFVGATFNSLTFNGNYVGPLAIGGNAFTVGAGGIAQSNAALVTISPQVTIGAASTWDVGAGGLTLDAGLGTSGNALTKTGDGTLTLKAASLRTGSTTILGGVIRIENATALGTTAGTRSVSNGATLELGNVILDRTMTLFSGATLRGTGASARSNGVMTVNAAATNVTFATVSSSDVLQLANGNGDLTGGSGSLILTVAGPGVVQVNNTHVGLTGNWYIAPGATLRAADGALGVAANDIILDGTFRSGGAFTLGSGRTITVTNAGSIDTLGGALTLGTAGQLTGAGALTKVGTSANALNINAANTGFTGNFVLNAGTVSLGAGNAIGSTVVNVGASTSTVSLLTIGSGVVDATSADTAYTVFANSRLVLNGASNLGALDSVTLNPNSGTVSAGVLDIASAAGVAQGTINHAAGSIYRLSNGNALSGGALPASSIIAGEIVQLNSTGSSYAGLGSLAAGAIVQVFGGNRAITGAGDVAFANNVLITMDRTTGDRTLLDDANGQIVVGSAGLTFAGINIATGGSPKRTLTVAESIDNSANAVLTFGTTAIVNGYAQDGVVVLGNTGNVYGNGALGAAMNVDAGTLAVQQGSVVDIPVNVAGGARFQVNGSGSNGLVVSGPVTLASNANLATASNGNNDGHRLVLTGSFSDTSTSTIWSLNGSGTNTLFDRGVHFRQGGSITINSTVRPHGTSGNRYGIVTFGNSTTATLTGLTWVEGTNPGTTRFAYSVTEDSKLIVSSTAILNSFRDATNAKELDIFGDGTGVVEYDAGFKAWPDTNDASVRWNLVRTFGVRHITNDSLNFPVGGMKFGGDANLGPAVNPLPGSTVVSPTINASFIPALGQTTWEIATAPQTVTPSIEVNRNTTFQVDNELTLAGSSTLTVNNSATFLTSTDVASVVLPAVLNKTGNADLVINRNALVFGQIDIGGGSGIIRLGGDGATSLVSNGSWAGTFSANIVLEGGVFSQVNEDNTGTYTFTRSLGSGANDIRWVSSGTGGGGFTAYTTATNTADGNMDVNIGGALAPLAWGDANFVQTGQPLRFGHTSQFNRTVSLLNPKVIADLELERHGLKILERPAANFWPIDANSRWCPWKAGGGI